MSGCVNSKLMLSFLWKSNILVAIDQRVLRLQVIEVGVLEYLCAHFCATATGQAKASEAMVTYQLT